ncbi:MAG: OB-fold nucleic acid binding domain-containing protein, partial [Candidatus Scatosoma sp.]
PEFLTAFLNNRISNITDIRQYTTYAKAEGIPVLPPDINESQAMFSVKDGKIRYGMGAIKNIGIGAITQITDERDKNGKFTSFEDFISRCAAFNLNKRMLENLIYAGAFDCFNHPRAAFAAVYEDVLSRVSAMEKQKSGAQISLFGSIIEEEKIVIDYPDITEYDQAEKLSLEKSVLGVYVSGHPFEKYAPYFKDKNFNCSMLEYEEDEETGEKKYAEIASGQQVSMGGMIAAYKKLQTKSGLYMAFVTVEDMYGTVECVCFPKIYDKIRNFLSADRVVSVTGKIDISEEKAPVIIVDKMTEFVPPEDKAAERTAAPREKTAEGAAGANGAVAAEKTLWLNITGLDERDVDELTDTLAYYGGDTEVIFVDKAKKPSKYKCSQKVSLSRALFAELSACLTEDKIKLL